ncbi:hypothetical protein EDB80DRAFT_714075 [Ilyonectria destructans]|nr:hypothetical protein EDB80DRAFT_714075 [Ilyonectria destructans]
MKVIVAGATGYVATEVIRQALSNKRITSLVALARRATSIPQNVASDADTTKLKSVVCDDFSNYPESIRGDLTGADAVIWLIAITPSRSKTRPWDEVRKVCLDYTVTGIETLSQLSGDRSTGPMRFIYTSGDRAERDPNKKPLILGEYSLMRGETESKVLNHAKESEGRVESFIIKPGLINATGGGNLLTRTVQAIGGSIINLPVIGLDEIAAALINMALFGAEKDTLCNEEIVKLGQRVLGEGQKA